MEKKSDTFDLSCAVFLQKRPLPLPLPLPRPLPRALLRCPAERLSFFLSSWCSLSACCCFLCCSDCTQDINKDVQLFPYVDARPQPGCHYFPYSVLQQYIFDWEIAIMKDDLAEKLPGGMPERRLFCPSLINVKRLLNMNRIFSDSVWSLQMRLSFTATIWTETKVEKVGKQLMPIAVHSRKSVMLWACLFLLR